MMKKTKRKRKTSTKVFSLIFSLFFMSFLVCSNIVYAVDTEPNNKDGLNTLEEIKTPIMGQAIMSRGQAFTFLKNRNQAKSNIYIEEFVNFVWEEAQAEGVRPDVAFCQMMHETGFLKFGGDVKEEQNNFAGIGATGGGKPGHSFESIQLGIRAVIQHLKAYATTQPLNKECVDPRFHLVSKGCAPNVEDLSGKWAVGSQYGENIVKLIDKGKTLEDHKATCVVEDLKIMDNNLECADKKLFNNKDYKIVAKANSTNVALYQFWLKDNRTSKITMLRDYKEDNILSWKAPASDNNYSIGVCVKDKYSPKETIKQSEKFENIKIVPGSSRIQSFAIYNGNKKVQGNNCIKGNEYTLRATSVSDNKALYRFWLKDIRQNKWIMLRDYSESNTFKWTVNVNPQEYLIGSQVKDKYSNNSFDQCKYSGMKVLKGNSTTNLESFGVYDGSNLATDLIRGKSYTIKASAKSNVKPLYRFWVKNVDTNKTTILSDYTEKNTFTWTAIGEGHEYSIGVDVRDKESLDSKDISKYTSLKIYSEGAKLQSFKVYDKSMEITSGVYMPGKTYTMKAVASASTEAMYQFWIKDLVTNRWTMLRDYSTDNTYSWIAPTNGENYWIGVHIKDKYSTERLDDHKYDVIKIYKEPSKPTPVQKKKIVLDAGHGNRNVKYNVIDSGAVGIGGVKESDLTKILTAKLGQYLSKYDYEVIYTRDYLNGYTAIGEDLQQRVEVANRNNADLFVSVHFDSSSSSVSGISTHYSSYRPNIDNSGLETIGDVIFDRTPCEQAILSKELATLIAKRLSELGFNNRGPKDHNLFVTRMTNIPSLLIEGGFVTNAEDLAKITNPDMQNKMAEKIGQAIRDFIK